MSIMVYSIKNIHKEGTLSYLSDTIEANLAQWQDWVLRRHKGIPNNKRLFVLACMDERLPVEQVLGLQPGDAHVFRNAGGVVTDDVIRSLALTLHAFGTREIIIVNHTDCGMLSAPPEAVTKMIEEKTGVDLSRVPLDPALPELRLTKEAVHRWWKMQTDIDQTALEQARLLREHPLVPKDVRISAYVYEVETGRLRRPGEILADKLRLKFY